MNTEKRECPYKEKDTALEHVFYYGSNRLHKNKLYCDNVECSNLEQDKAYFVKGEGKPVGICRTNGFVDSENSELVGKIKESSFFKALEDEKAKEARKERLAEEILQLGKG